MCERLSWIELGDGRLLYLTTYDLWNTPAGKKIREQLGPDDWWGHSAIKMFYGHKPQDNIGVDRECTDYTSPVNFPPEIAQAIKEGKFRDIADPVMLTTIGRNKWAAHDKAWAAHDKACAAYNKACAAYNKACAALNKTRAAYDNACSALNKTRAAYNNACSALDKTRAAYNKARDARDKAWAAYNKARAALDKTWADYNKARAASSNPYPGFWKIFAVQRYRAQTWREKHDSKSTK